MYKNIKINFTINPYRKGRKENKFNAELSPYWQQQYDDMFRRWR